MINSILNINISGFENCQGTIPKTIRLLNWLTNEKYWDKVNQLRAIQDEDLQKVIKDSLPAITPSGLFSYRDKEHLIEHSGFLVFDIDFKDNQHISNFNDLKSQLSHIRSIAYCGLSVRGRGYWGLVPIPKSTPEEHKYRFAALAKGFKDAGIILDKSGSDICRLRIYSWDPEAYFNHDAKLYIKILKPQPRKTTSPVYSDTRDKVEAMIERIKLNRIDITEGYDNWLKIGSALENEFGEAGRGYFHSVSSFNSGYGIQDTDRMFDNVLKHNNGKVKIGSFFHIADEYGIKITFQKSGESNQDTDIPSIIDKKLIDTKKEHSQVTTIPKVEKKIPVKHGPWDAEITELQRFFQVIPDGPIKLNQCETIIDPVLFIKSHLDIMKAQNGNKRYLPYLERLNELKTILSLN